MSDADRLTRLEERIADQERTIDELSDQIAEQWRVIEGLRKQSEATAERLGAYESESAVRPEGAKPPHY